MVPMVSSAVLAAPSSIDTKSGAIQTSFQKRGAYMQFSREVSPQMQKLLQNALRTRCPSLDSDGTGLVPPTQCSKLIPTLCRETAALLERPTVCNASRPAVNACMLGRTCFGPWATATARHRSKLP